MNLTSKRVLQMMSVCAGACALTASAQIQWVGDNFENEGVGYTNAAIDSAAGLYKANIWGSSSQYTNLAWSAAPGDASKIVATPGAYAGTHPLAPSATAQVLQLETEGQTLTRFVNFTEDDGSSSDGIPLKTPTTISFAAAPAWVDTLIKFTPSEDDPEITDPNIKIAVFVNVNSNLVVRHKYFDGASLVATNSVFDSLGVIDPADWHRLTIKLAYSEEGDYGFADPACEIFLDNTKLTHANGAEKVGVYTGGSWFFSLKAGDTALEQISFQGTGFVDELVVTDTTPADIESAGLLLTLSFNDSLLDVTIDSVAVTNGQPIASGSTLNISAIDWYQINGVTGTGIGYNGTTGEQVKVSSGIVTADDVDRTATIEAVQYTGTIATGLPGAYANVNAGSLAAWAVESGLTEAQVIANAADYLDNYLLNVDESTDAKIKITSIVYDGTKATITVEAEDDSETDAVDFTDINGTILVWTSDTISGFGEPTSYTVVGTTATVVTIEVPVGNGQFIKARVE